MIDLYKFVDILDFAIKEGLISQMASDLPFTRIFSQQSAFEIVECMYF